MADAPSPTGDEVDLVVFRSVVRSDDGAAGVDVSADGADDVRVVVPGSAGGQVVVAAVDRCARSDQVDAVPDRLLPDDEAATQTDDTTQAVEVRRWAELAARALGHLGEHGELELSFVDADEMQLLNSQHMGVDRPTDVLSFPLDGLDHATLDDQVAASGVGDAPSPPRLLGDVVICPTVAALNAPLHAGTLDDELALLTVHGVLHVLGYDHADPVEANEMRLQEADLLIRFHWHGPAPADFRHEHLDDERSPTAR